MRHLIDSTDLSVAEIDRVLNLADDIIRDPAAYAECCRGKILATLFYEPSTRTRLSFEAAMLRLGGKVEGGLLQPGFESFVGAYPLTTRYGLTPGEFARLANEEQHIGCQLHVLPVLGWKREMLFPETGLYWMMPSPAIPNFETALLYPGTCLTEATNISEGRGTSAPFELIGAPFINGAALADRMNAKKLPGVIFTAAYFTPSASKHAGRRCEGVHIHLTDTKAYDTIRTGTALLYAIREIYPNDFALRQPEDEKALLPINRLTGSDVLAHDWPDFDALMERWENEAKAFDERAVFARMYE